MDYVFVATSYASGKGSTPKDMCCGNSRNSPTLTRPERDRSCQHSTHGLVWDCLWLFVSSAWGKRGPATHKNDSMHTACPKNPHASHIPKSNKCSFYCQMSFMKCYLEEFATIALFLHVPLPWPQHSLGTLKINAKPCNFLCPPLPPSWHRSVLSVDFLWGFEEIWSTPHFQASPTRVW